MWKCIAINEILMRNVTLFLLIIAASSSCFSQKKFEIFVKKFRLVALPIDGNISTQGTDTLNGKETNDILIRKQAKKPQYIDKSGSLKIIKQYYGLYPEEPFGYLKDIKNSKGQWEEKRFYFYSKVIPIARIKLSNNYISLIIKVVDYETTFYDLWNFSKDGEALSIVCLFWGMRDAGPGSEKVTFTIVNSMIKKDGSITWHESDNGLETFRTYKLNNEGYFQVVKEEQKGKSEY